MNRTQQLTLQHLNTLALDDHVLLLEALLRRGFLAFQHNKTVYLGSGSHDADVEVLKLIKEIEIKSVHEADRVASISIRNRLNTRSAVAKIISLGENHVGDQSQFTGQNVATFTPHYWNHYTSMQWGAKRAVCPTTDVTLKPVQGALDLGIALLVKVLPLARVATSFSCDGHGSRAAEISFHYAWDPPWCSALFSVLGVPTQNSTWQLGKKLIISPLQNDYRDTAVIELLNDIQYFARRLLDNDVIEHIGRARKQTISSFCTSSPTPEEFGALALKNLRATLS